MSGIQISDIDRAKSSWLMGVSGEIPVPENWNSDFAGGDAAESQLRMVTLVGQALHLMVEPECNEPFRERAEAPDLKAPTIPENLRSEFRRALQLDKKEHRMAQILTLVAHRGYVSHPDDWFPSSQSSAWPDIYDPWIHWIAGSGSIQDFNEEEINSETWQDFTPAAKARALVALRINNPDQALQLLATHLAGESAEVRLKLLAALETGLNENDIPFLKSLSGDRSQKVKSQAHFLLARLGEIEVNAEEVDELKSFFIKGTLLNKKAVQALKCKNPAQERNRNELMQRIPFKAFADALQISPLELVQNWPVNNKSKANVPFTQMLTLTGEDSLIEAWAHRLVDSDDADEDLLLVLKERLKPETRQELVRKALRQCHFSSAALVELLTPNLGTLPAEELLKSRVWKEFLKVAAKAEDKWDHPVLRAELFDFGLLLEHSGISEIFSAFEKAGWNPHDPGLCLLRLNANLPSVTVTDL